MSKVIVLPLLAAAGMGVAWVAKKKKDFWDSVSPEDRRFLLPLGAGRDRLQLDPATISYRPMEGVDFEASLPAFEIPDVVLNGSRYLPTEIGVAASLPQIQALKMVESEAKAMGFDPQRRVTAPTSDIVVLDLSTLEAVRERARGPIAVG